MAKWQILVLKEIRHLFRDTKTIVQTVVVPTFITPLLIGAIVWGPNGQVFHVSFLYVRNKE